MSNVSHTHNITPYATGVTKAFTGQRLATVTYKTDKDTGIKPDSKSVSIPMLNVEDIKATIDNFIPHMVALAERTQDAIIRNLHESGATIVHDDQISIAAIHEYLNAEATGGRLTRVQVVEWFDNTIADPLALALATKMGISDTPTAEENKRVEGLLNEFRNNIGALTAGNTSYDPDTCKVLQKALSFAGDDDKIAAKFMVRLDTMQKKVPKSMADAL